MGLRDRLIKVLGGQPTPQQMRDSAAEQGMGVDRPFSPGQPIDPFDGYSTTPRSYDYKSAYNINSRPRADERVAFTTIRALLDSYDIAEMCIWHRIDSLRGLEWNLVPAKGVEGDIDDQIAYAQRIMAKPDGYTPFGAWFAQWLYDVLGFDAGCLSRIRNNAGRPIGLRVIDGTTIAPLLDRWGDTPKAPAEAFVQYAQGVPWTWLTTEDLIYQPFRPKTRSPYGTAPIESILLNANTDLRLQAYFLQKFTDGNIPAAFAMAPESWGPTQIKEFQEVWDAYLKGDQAWKSMIRWIPGGTGLAWSNEKDFKDELSLLLLRKTCATFHVQPADLGFTENVNKSSGETQADVGSRVADRPLLTHAEGIFNDFLQKDLGLQVAFEFDYGREEEDRLQTAQADQIYIQNGVVSVSEVAQRRFGISEPDGTVVPRFIWGQRTGPVPLSVLYAQAGPVEQETGAPIPGAQLPVRAFQELPGVVPEPPLPEDPLAVQEAGPSALPPPPETKAGQLVGKAETAGLTSATGTYGSPMLDDQDEPIEQPSEVAKEAAAFQRFVKARRRDGKWRDFTFTHADPIRAHRANDVGRAAVRKAAGEIIAAGLAVLAEDTGRVLMLQRALDPTDPAGGCWEFPGGHVETGEEPFAAAWREWQEETGNALDPVVGQHGGSWLASNGIYRGFVWIVPAEAVVDLTGRGQVSNPDDPDGDVVEAIAWINPADVAGMPLRTELAADLPQVFTAFAPAVGPFAATNDPNGNWLTVDQARAAAELEVAKSDPKAGWRDNPANTAHGDYDLALTDHYAPLIADTLDQLWTDTDLRVAITAAQSVLKGTEPALPDPDTARLEQLIRNMVADAFAAGVHVGFGQTGDTDLLADTHIDWSTWEPGNTTAADMVADGRLAALLERTGVTIKGIVGTTLDRLGNLLATGLASGDPSDTIAAAMRGLLGSAKRAELIAHTETARAMSSGSLDVYAANGLSGYDLVISGGACPECVAIAAANPHPLSDEADAAPVHPFCRCAVSPVVGS